jgi:hypothetical protein
MCMCLSKKEERGRGTFSLTPAQTRVVRTPFFKTSLQFLLLCNCVSIILPAAWLAGSSFDN